MNLFFSFYCLVRLHIIRLVVYISYLKVLVFIISFGFLTFGVLRLSFIYFGFFENLFIPHKMF